MTDDRTIAELADRVGRLERQNRLLRRLGGAGLLGMLLVVVIGGAIDDDNIRCKFLTITGPRGEPRIRLIGGNADQFGGRVTMEILDPGGKRAAEAFWDPNGQSGRFVVYTNDGTDRIFRAMP
jgi:hypothetical protein